MTYRGRDTLDENIFAIIESTRKYRQDYPATGDLSDLSADDN